MRVGAVLSPVAEWKPIIEAARAADDAGLDSVGFWDHYHSPKPEWGYACGWSAYGYLAAITERVRFVPMVLNALHYELGVLAKESSMLAIASADRFELAIGAGDWPESFVAWGAAYPDASTRLEMLEEKVRALTRIWRGEPVSFDGEHVRLDGAICTPAPPRPPRVIVGVGASRRTLRSAVAFADEVNLYTDPALLEEAQRLIAASGRDVGVSIFLSWEFDKWPADAAAALREWAERGVDRAFVSIGTEDMRARVSELATFAG